MDPQNRRLPPFLEQQTVRASVVDTVRDEETYRSAAVHFFDLDPDADVPVLEGRQRHDVAADGLRGVEAGDRNRHPVADVEAGLLSFGDPQLRLREQLLCRQLRLKPEDHLLEIGTGWGGFALHAARHYGCRVTTTTISAEQHARACERVAAAGLADRVTILQDDFRDLDGQYDKLVSIEMIEAVDHALLPAFFRKCGELLAPHGAMLIQAITMADQRYEDYRKSVDFIRRYIFPGGNLPSAAVMTDCAVRETGLRLLGLEDIGLHYATTLAHWRRNFFRQLGAVREMGYPEAFIRMWDFYLCYCEGAFRERAISDVLMLWTGPESRLRTL